MRITLVTPVFNEQETISEFYKTVRNCEGLKPYEIEIVFINDGSSDSTEDIIDALAMADKDVIALHLTRNFGKEAALVAGLDHATGDAAIPIDVDLQDPIEVVPIMIEKWQQGADIVLGKRADRSSDSWLKRFTAQNFYKVHNKLSKPKIEENVSDFRLISRPYINKILAMPERNLFMKGMFTWVGGKTEIVEYTRAQRFAGTSKFNGFKLWNFALEGITNFSTAPLKIWTYIGLIIAGLAFLFGLYMILAKIFWGNPVSGYPSLIVSIVFLGGIQLIGIGVLGEYIGRIYLETKQRPRYLLKEPKKGSQTASHESSGNTSDEANAQPLTEKPLKQQSPS